MITILVKVRLRMKYVNKLEFLKDKKRDKYLGDGLFKKNLFILKLTKNLMNNSSASIMKNNKYKRNCCECWSDHVRFLSRVHTRKSDGLDYSRMESHVLPLPMTNEEVANRLLTL